MNSRLVEDLIEMHGVEKGLYIIRMLGENIMNTDEIVANKYTVIHMVAVTNNYYAPKVERVYATDLKKYLYEMGWDVQIVFDGWHDMSKDFYDENQEEYGDVIDCNGC